MKKYGKKRIFGLIVFCICFSIAVINMSYYVKAEDTDSLQTEYTDSSQTSEPVVKTKMSREIYGSDVVDTYEKDKIFELKVWTDGEYDFSFKSSDENVVKISSSGDLTIKGCGEAVINISDNGTDEYYPSYKDIKVYIFPPTPVVKKAVPKGNGSIYFAWKGISVLKKYEKSGYEIILEKRGSRNIKEFGAKKKSILIPNLQKKKKYAISIRSYVIVNDKKYYSSWSKAKTIKVK